MSVMGSPTTERFLCQCDDRPDKFAVQTVQHDPFLALFFEEVEGRRLSNRILYRCVECGKRWEETWQRQGNRIRAFLRRLHPES